MSLVRCLAKLNAQLRDFNTGEVRDAAEVYRSRGREDRDANVAAIEDHLRDLKQQRAATEKRVLDAWKERDPEGYAQAQRPALDLQGETHGELRAREAQQAKEAEQQRRVANAPSEKGFTLTGSDRMVDEAEARGQKGMFARGPIYYSELGRQVESAKTESAPAPQWKAFIDNLAAKGVKRDEIEWSGVKDWLDMQQGKVTKEQVQQFLRDNGVKVEETTLGSPEADSYKQLAATAAEKMERSGALWRRIDDELSNISQVSRANLRHWTEEAAKGDSDAQAKIDALRLTDEQRALVKQAGEARMQSIEADAVREKREAFGVTRYERYKLPGGHNYRELLLTLPARDSVVRAKLDRINDEFNALVDKYGSRDRMPPEQRIEVDRLEREHNAIADAPRGDDFRSSHFDQPNILAHVRFDERTDAAGKKVLFIEEIQSDWAQKGKREGFQDPKLQQLEARRREIEAKGAEATSEERREWAGLMNRIRPDNRDVEGNTGFKGVPAAPFVGKTEAWVALAVKRMIRYAAENGFDRVAWTTGEQQAARYDLSKHISELNYRRLGDGYEIGMKGADGSVLGNQHVPDARLAETVGKDLADKIRNGDGNKTVNGLRVFTGLDLKIGGEGMKAFYDKIVPNVVNDVLKKVGGGRVGEVPIEDPKYFRKGGFVGNKDAIARQPGFDITPAMRDAAMAGLPMFNRAKEAGRGMAVEDVRQVVEPIVAKWTNAPDVHVLESFEKAPIAIRDLDKSQSAAGADGKPYAFFHEGSVYLVASEIHSVRQAVEGLYHESLGHYGLRGVFGKTLEPLLAQLAVGRQADVLAKAKEYGLDPLKREDRLTAAEEVLAELAQTRPEMGVVQRAVAAIRNFLRDHGVDVKWSDNDIIQKFILPARGWVERGKAAALETGSRFARASEAKPEDVKDTPSKGKLFDSVKEVTKSWVDEIQKAVAPMAAGSDRARAVAKDYANSERLARYQWAVYHQRLTRLYKPEQLKKMWEAADEENVLQQQGKSTKGKGLDTLAPEERAEVERMHQYANALLAQAKDAGLFKGEGLPYWTPRMVAMIGKDGEFLTEPGKGEGTSSPFNSPTGRNISTSASSLKHREHLTTAETEAAAQAKFGADAQVVKDIRTMPLAMARLERAVAGRQLINAIRDIGTKAGEEIISSGEKPGFFTVDSPAFKTFRPKFEEVDGKQQPVTDSQGNVVFDKVPIYVAKEFEGPLKAIMSDKPGKIYSALMSLKAKTMGLIMYSPLIHNAVEWGRALPLMPGKVATFKIYFEGNAIRKDETQMREFIDAGLVPIGKRFQNQDISGIVEEPTLKPGRSLTAKALGNAVGAINGKAGEAVKRGVDAAGDFWHNTLLWDRVADLQMGIAANMRDYAMAKGLDRESALRVASHLANRYAGALPNEAMSTMARKVANISLFSRTFTLGNLGVMKDMVTGLPKDVQAQIRRDAGDIALKQAKSLAQKKAIHAFMLDIALLYAGNAALQSAFDYWRRDKSLSDIEKGYVDRFNRLLDHIKESPAQLLNVFGNLQSLSPTGGNEPGKEDRVLFGYAKDGTAIYVRLPTGKIGEEFKGWLTSPLDMLKRKESTIVRPTIQAFTNDKGFGRPVYDDKAKGLSGSVKAAGNIVWNYMSQQLPMDSVKAAGDLMKGRGDDQVNAYKVVGPLVGLTFSKGAPGGPAVGQLFEAEREHQAQVQHILPDVRELVQDGKRGEAIALMRESKMTPQEISITLRYATSPAARLNPRRLQKFNEIATPDEIEAMRRLRQSSP